MINDNQPKPASKKRYPEGDPRNRRQWKPWYKRYWIIRGRRREDRIARWIVICGAALALAPVVYVIASPEPTTSAYLPYIIGGGQRDAATEVLDRVNAARKNAGCPPLTPNPQLQQAASDWSQHMADADVFAHRNLAQLHDIYGYTGAATGENIAAGYPTPDAVVAGWLASPGHRANILNCNYTDSGIGYTSRTPDGGQLRYGVYWTQNFGIPQGTGISGESGTDGSAETWNAPEGLIDPAAPAPQP